MPNYNFLNLSPAEFENVTRDLLQKKYNTFFESFADGKDSGIDLRFSSNKRNSIVIQCKRYEKFDQLLSNLKKEKNKIKILNPQRYILVTTVPITALRKKRIDQILQPYIKDYDDIIGKKDLNNLLTQYPGIEKHNFKLWLSSINILETIIHNKIINQSIFEKEKFLETQKVYVINDSFNKAIKILNKYNYVILSGIPGIGKTTLARILVCYYIDKGFDDFIYLSDNIGEAYTLFQEGKRQVFLFDDFLGRTSLNNFSTNEEKRIISLIEKINSSQNKILILATREYILRDAKQKYDLFEDSSLDIVKCIIDIATYNKEVRAKILYNHLFFSTIPRSYLDDLMFDNRYLELIKHKSFNPRIIEVIKKETILKSIEPKKFFSTFLSFLKDSNKIWQHIYENQISELSKCILNLLASTSTPIFYEDLSNLVFKFSIENSLKYDLKYSIYEFKRSINVLQGTFILIERDSKNKLIIEFQNPSVLDFIVSYLKKNEPLVIDIINSASYFNQLFEIFTYVKEDENRIYVNEELYPFVIRKLISDFENLNNSIFWYFKSTYSSYINKISSTDKVYEIISRLKVEKGSKLDKFLFDKFDSIDIISLSPNEKIKYVYILDHYKVSCKSKAETIINDYHQSITTIDEIEEYDNIEKIFPEELSKVMKEDAAFGTKILTTIDSSIQNCAPYNYEDLKVQITKIEKKFGLVLTFEKEEIDEKIVERDKKESLKENEIPILKKESTTEMSDKDIINMFNTLYSEIKY